jgi:competence protein ComEA
MESQNKKFIIILTLVITLAAAASLYKSHSKPRPIKITESAPTEQPAYQQKKPKPRETATCIIQLSGEVPNPGLYTVTPNQRVFDILNQFGGVLDTADTTKVKLAAKIKDGMTIYIPEQKAPKTPAQKKQQKSHTTKIKKPKDPPNNDITSISPKTSFKMRTH